MTSWPDHLPSGNRKQSWRDPVALRARLGATLKVDPTDEEIAALFLAAENPEPFLDADEIAAVAILL